MEFAFHILSEYLSDVQAIRWLSTCKYASLFRQTYVCHDLHRMHKIPITSLSRYLHLRMDQATDWLWMSHLRCSQLHINLSSRANLRIMSLAYRDDQTKYILPRSIHTLHLHQSTMFNDQFVLTHAHQIKHVHLSLPTFAFQLRTFHHFKFKKAHQQCIITLPDSLISLHLNDIRELPLNIPSRIQSLSFRRILCFVNLSAFTCLHTLNIQRYEGTQVVWPINLVRLNIRVMTHVNWFYNLHFITFLKIDCLKVQLMQLPSQLKTLIIHKCGRPLEMMWPLCLETVEVHQFSQRIHYYFPDGVKRLVLNQYRSKHLQLPSHIRHLHVPYCALSANQIILYNDQFTYAHTRNYVK